MTTTPPLLAISLTEPWAILSVAPLLTHYRAKIQDHTIYTVALAGKPPKVHETRSWRLKARLPVRIVMHASKGHADLRDFLIHGGTYTFRDAFAYPLSYCGYSTVDPWLSPADYAMVPDTMNGARTDPIRRVPLGAIVGMVTITECIHSERATPAHSADLSLGDWSEGRWCWRMVDPWLAPVPIPCRGFQGMWPVGDAEQAKLREQGARW